jgi:hypothetical protein
MKIGIAIAWLFLELHTAQFDIVVGFIEFILSQGLSPGITVVTAIVIPSLNAPVVKFDLKLARR